MYANKNKLLETNKISLGVRMFIEHLSRQPLIFFFFHNHEFCSILYRLKDNGQYYIYSRQAWATPWMKDKLNDWTVTDYCFLKGFPNNLMQDDNNVIGEVEIWWSMIISCNQTRKKKAKFLFFLAVSLIKITGIFSPYHFQDQQA